MTIICDIVKSMSYHPILERRSTILLLLLLLLCMLRSGYPPWILKRGGMESSGRKLISSRDSGEGSEVDRPIWLHSTRIKAIAPRGAYFFQIIILYHFHGGSKTVVFIQARLNPAQVNHIIWELFRLDNNNNNKGLCSLCGCKTRWFYQRYMLPWELRPKTLYTIDR